MRRNQWVVLVFAVVGLSCTITGFKPSTSFPFVERNVTTVDEAPEQDTYPNYQVPAARKLVELDDGEKVLGVFIFPNEHQECFCMIGVGREAYCRCQGTVPEWAECWEVDSDGWGPGDVSG